MLSLHDNGILHCNLFPNNILFHKDDDHMYIVYVIGDLFLVKIPYIHLNTIME
jgi:serine/threonine protein kinase